MKSTKNELTTLLIIGNGFDKYCGLKSSFSDYFNHLMETFSIHYRMKDLLNNSSFHYVAFSSLVKDIDITSSRFTVWDLFFLVSERKKKGKVINWSDLETLIYESFVKKSGISDIGIDTDFWSECLKRLSYDSIKNDNRELRKDVDIVTAYLYIVFSHFSTLENNSKSIRALSRYLKSELEKFESNFKEYLVKELADNIDYENNKRELLNAILINYQKSNVLSFNYTKIGNSSFIEHVEHVHGSLEDKTCIIGIDSTKIDYSHYAYKFTKTYRKIEMFTKMKPRFVAKVLDKQINRIIFFGHSLNEQDYAYFQTIFDFYDIYNNDITLEFKYHVYDESRELDIQTAATTGPIKLIETYGTTLDNKFQGKNLLHRLLNEKRIEILHIG